MQRKGFLVVLFTCFVAVLFMAPALTMDCIAADKVVLRWGTSSVGSTGYNWCAGLTNIINRYTDYEASVVPSGGSAATVRALNRKQREFGWSAGYAVFTGYTGTREFSKDGKQEVRLVAKAYDACFTLVAQPGIETVHDFKGKVFMYRRKPNPHWTLFGDALLDVYGLRPDKDVKCPYSTMTKEVTDGVKMGTVDIGLTAGGIPRADVMEVTESRVKKYNIIGFDKDKIAAINKRYPFYKPMTIPGGTYSNQDKDAHSMAYSMTLACRPDLPDDVVYNVTKVIFSHFDEFVKIMPAAKKARFSAEAACKDPEIPMHPGAIKYYKEIGAWKD